MREVKKKEWQKPRRMKKKRVKRGKESRKKEENETEAVKRRCEGCVSVEVFEMFSHGEDLERCGDLSREDLLE